MDDSAMFYTKKERRREIWEKWEIEKFIDGDIFDVLSYIVIWSYDSSMGAVYWSKTIQSYLNWEVSMDWLMNSINSDFLLLLINYLPIFN